MEIRKVSVELVRAGPRHNQLLSPLTQYLGMCGDSQAGVVQLHFEHAPFLRRLNELRYQTEAAASQQRRLEILRETGTDVARVLKQVPGLSGIFSGDPKSGEVLIHLQLVMSASELALLPFELSKVLEEAEVGGGGWLALQNRVATCITRRIRSVSSKGIRWSSKPRILFVAADPRDIPFAEHKRALEEAIKPWLMPGEESEEEWLTILEDASIKDVRDACERNEYTHVHLLAHGANDESGDRLAFGIDLGGEILSGERFATAISRGRKRPTVVTVASCDSGNPGSVITQGASFAHDLHSAGIPLVIASQFPLSKEGSVLMASKLYPDLLWGSDPRIALCNLRSDLHALHGGDSHDWASLAVYEAFPGDLENQLEELRYHQALGALKAALRGLGSGGYYDAEAYPVLMGGVAKAQDRLPREGRLAAECLGLKASSKVYLAQLEYDVADPQGELSSEQIGDCLQLLEDSYRDYRRSGEVVEEMLREYLKEVTSYSPHWVQTQALALGMILGRPFDEQLWQRAKTGAEQELQVAGEDVRAWAHGSLAELWLLRLSDPGLSAKDRRARSKKVTQHARAIRDLMGPTSVHVASTRSQFEHYTGWWGDPAFSTVSESLGVSRKQWHVADGISETAAKVVAILGGRQVSRRESTKRPARSASPKKRPAKKEAVKTEPAKEEPAKEEGAKKPGRRGARKRPQPVAEPARDPEVIFDVEMVPAENGDCLWIEYGSPAAPRRLLIDCGAKSAATLLEKRIGGLPAERKRFELFVLTHIDSDHISGVVPLFESLGPDVEIHDLWFNGWKQFPREFLGVRQGEEFSDLIAARKMPWNRSFTAEEDEDPRPVAFAEGRPLPSVPLAGGMRLTVLSPGPQELEKLAKKWLEGLKELKPELFLGRKKPPAKVTDFEAFDVEALAKSKIKKDPSVANGSSIALLVEFGGRVALLTGDAHAEVLAASIRRLQAERGKEGEKLRLDALKLSHHGSANALTPELLELLDCRRYLVSSDGSRFYHPDREAIARVVIHGGERPELYFNYRSEFNELWDHAELRQRHGYATTYPAHGKQGLRVEL